MVNCNFFWHGNSFNFMNRLVICSHLKQNHNCTIHLYGDEPKSEYWIADLSQINIVHINDKKYEQYLNKLSTSTWDQKVRLISDLFSFELLYESTDFYVDCDIFALKNWSKFNEVFTSDDNGCHYSIGIMKTNKIHNQIFKYCIENIKPFWGNVELFTEACIKFNQNFTCNHSIFHPFIWKYALNFDLNRTHRLLTDNFDLYKDSYGIHYFGYMLSQSNIQINENNINNYKDSVLYKLYKDFWI